MVATLVTLLAGTGNGDFNVEPFIVPLGDFGLHIGAANMLSQHILFDPSTPTICVPVEFEHHCGGFYPERFRYPADHRSIVECFFNMAVDLVMAGDAADPR